MLWCQHISLPISSVQSSSKYNYLGEMYVYVSIEQNRAYSGDNYMSQMELRAMEK